MSNACIRRLAALVLASFAFSNSGLAYYYYVSFNTRSAPYTPIVEKFNITALTNKTIPFFISDQGPAVVYPGDSFAAIISEIRAAADVWNNVSTCDIRVRYGGLFTAGTNQNAAGINVEFSDNIPPGLLALGGPTTLANGTAQDASGVTFTPIVRSTLYLHRDLSAQIASYGVEAASYSEQFFVTLVHEFGHTLGLQHTLASSVMSTLWTTGSSKASPLGLDDTAAISLLYPSAGYQQTVGSISGRVTLNGTGVNLASVVALSASNPAISALTNPDGTYEIDGIPPGQYFVYAHPLPPALQGESSPANIVYPTDANGNPLTLNYTAFATQFYSGVNGGTRDQQQALSVFVTAQNVSMGINFNVASRSSQALASVRTYGWTSTNTAITSPNLFVGVPSTMAATGVGLLQANNTLTSGLSVGMLGTSAQIYNLRPYPPPTPYIAFDVMPIFTAGPGPKHLLFSTATDLYVLPSGFFVATNPPPGITSVTAAIDSSGNRIAIVSGTGFNSGTRILFEGLPGVIQGTTNDGSLLVTPPPGPGSYSAPVVALNADGQSSLFLNPVPPTFSYAYSDSPALTVAPSFLSPGSDITVDVVAANATFDSTTTIGFGTSDVLVKHVIVLTPSHLNVIVTPNTFVSTAAISATTGLQVISQALGNQITITDTQKSTK